MEIIQAMTGFLVAFVVISAIAQLAMSYALQVISEKNELPEFASFLSWIPILNLYPLIRCGGGDFRKFVLGAVGCVVLAGAAGAMSAAVGPIIGGVLVAVLAIAVVVYFTRIIMNTAESRGISKWFGLLAYVPIANFFVYPYIAFHDGFRAPHKIGVAIGLLVAIGPIPGQLKLLETLEHGATAFEQAQEGDFAALAEATEGTELGAMLEQMGPAIEIASGLAALETMNASDPEQAAMMRTRADGLRQKLAQAGDALDPNAKTEFEQMLQQIDARLAQSGGDAAMPQSELAQAGDFAAQAAPAPLVLTAPITDSIQRQGDLGYDVPTTVPCATGTQAHGAAPPESNRQWCSTANGGLKHGWLTEWHENGQPAMAGEYQEGLKVGIWTRWHENGTKRAQAEFHQGQQDGALIAWNDQGAKVHESNFVEGTPASR
jgi:hypothetical protein